MTRLDALPDALASLPAARGVAQILGPDSQPLVTARATNLRRWASTRLGAPRPVKPGRRPPTDLRPLARAIRHAPARSAFRQRLIYERWMAESVPLSMRRDLRPPAYLHLDPAERFPRVTLRLGQPADNRHFGPFRERRAAERSLKPLHKLFPLRPCDFEFEPHPALPLGLNCLYAQVKSCAAPCLMRTTEDGYRALASRAAAFLGDAAARTADVAEWLPSWVAAADARAVVAERTPEGVDLYPVRAGAVIEQGLVQAASPGALEPALARIDWSAPPTARDDRPWLVSFFSAAKARAVYAIVSEDLAARLRELLAERV